MLGKRSYPMIRIISSAILVLQLVFLTGPIYRRTLDFSLEPKKAKLYTILCYIQNKGFSGDFLAIFH